MLFAFETGSGVLLITRSTDLVFVSDQHTATIYLKDMKTNAVTILVNNTVARRMALGK